MRSDRLSRAGIPYVRNAASLSRVPEDISSEHYPALGSHYRTAYMWSSTGPYFTEVTDLTDNYSGSRSIFEPDPGEFPPPYVQLAPWQDIRIQRKTTIKCRFVNIFGRELRLSTDPGTGDLLGIEFHFGPYVGNKVTCRSFRKVYLRYMNSHPYKDHYYGYDIDLFCGERKLDDAEDMWDYCMHAGPGPDLDLTAILYRNAIEKAIMSAAYWLKKQIWYHQAAPPQTC